MPESKLMGGLRDQLDKPLGMSLNPNIVMTPEKVESKSPTMNPKMHCAKRKCKRSDNADRKRSDDSPDWGKCQLSYCTDRDDRAKFL